MSRELFTDAKGMLIPLFLSALLLFGSCAAEENTNRYEAEFITLFDTVSTVVGYAGSKAEFTVTAQRIYDELLEYHKLFNIYSDYPGLNNLKTVNDNAGISPVKVDDRLIDLIEFCRDAYYWTDGKVNAAMGSVLSKWQSAREDGITSPDKAELPEMGELKKASDHVNFDAVIVDRKASTVYISDPGVNLDVGAIAKGYAVEQICKSIPSGYLISVGGNVKATGKNPESGAPWIVGINDPEGNENYLHTLNISDMSVVTSGGYERYYTVDGEKYHHIIDPETLMPADSWSSVTVVCSDSGAADALSTALFLMSAEEGMRLLESHNAEAMWVDTDGEELFSPGFYEYIRT